MQLLLHILEVELDISENFDSPINPGVHNSRHIRFQIPESMNE